MQNKQIIDRVAEEHLWDQVLHRHADGEFLYAVTTMGIYCRPACPSPRPLRKNVQFFHSPLDAEAAGFRACKRCDPKGERARLAQDVVRDASEFIESSEEISSLEALAITVDDPALSGTIRAVLDFLHEPKQALDLPLDLRGTAFQQRVWRTLCSIPAGETRTYAQPAEMAGNPKATER